MRLADADIDIEVRPAPSTWRRLWSLPLWAHALALTVLLVLLVPLLRPDRSFSSDEGAAILEAKRLSAGLGWLTPNQFHDVDPEGKSFFYDLSDGGPDAFATFGKHPAYPLTLSVLDRVGGTIAMELLSVVGAVAAALAGAALARRLDPRLDRATLWALGAGSPLLFDSQLVLAHTLGAALCGWATFELLRARDQQTVHVGHAVVGVALIAGATFLRTETLLFAGAVAVVFVVQGVRAKQWGAAAVGAGAAVVSLVVSVLDRRWSSHVIETDLASIPSTVREGFLGTRVSGALDTLLLPGATWPAFASIALLALLIAVLGGALLVRRDTTPSPLFRACCVVAVVASIVPLLVRQPDTVPSTLITFPVLAAGLVLIDRQLLRSPDAAAMGGVFLVFTLAVVTTQYVQGGGAEWGSRFLAIGLPVVAPLAVAALARTGARMPRPAMRLALGSLLAVTVAMSLLSLSTLRYYRGNIDTWVRLTEQAQAGRVGPDLGDGDRRPVFLTTWSGFGRFSWPVSPAPRGLTIPTERLRSYGEALRRAGVREVLLASYDVDRDLAALDGVYRMVERIPSGSGPIAVLQAV